MRALVWAAMVVAVMVASAGVPTRAQLPPMQFTHRVVLDQNNVYVMLWTPLKDSIVIEVQVGARGYVGLGFSPNGGMKGADMVVGWVDDTDQVFLHDRYAEGNWAPAVDVSQDVRVLGGYQNATHTVLRFSRPWKTLDTNDYMLGEDTVRVVWAYSGIDPTSPDDLRYHDARGTKSMYLQAPPLDPPPQGSDVKTLDLLSYNVSLPSDMDTIYWCMMFSLPNITTKHHIIGYAPLLQKENLEHVHHIILYECNVPEHGGFYDQWVGWEGTQCYNPNMPPSWKSCTSAMFAWAAGGEGEMFPEHVGFAFGERGSTTHFMMEMHYDNPNLRQGVLDSSGIRVFYTDKLRQYDAGTLLVGYGHHLIIPGGQVWQASAYCDPSCTRQHLPRDGVKFFQGLLHSHTLGHKLALRHGRDGLELPPVLTDMNYDFNYQITRILKDEVTVLPGDNLVMDCGYNSMRRPVTTYGGLGTKEEMCVAFMSYYPRIDLSYCGSQPQLDTVLNALGIEQATNKDKVAEILAMRSEMDVEAENQLLEKRRNGTLSIGAEPMIFAQVLDMINVTAPQKFFNRSLYNILNDRATWAEGGATAALQRAVLEGKHHPICHMNGDGIFRRGDTVITAPSLKPLPSTMPEVTFMHTLVLDTQGSFLMLWTPREDDIVFEIQVGTTGYVGLGFSPTGGMTGADIVLGWVDDNDQVFLHDTYAEANGAPTIDNSQDVTLLGGYQNATHTVIRFSRPWNTCDGEQDYILSEDTVRVIWAYSGRDPTDARRLHYHDARGTKSLYLQSPQFELPAMGPDVKTWDFLSPNVSLPEDLDTLYWCKIYKIPPMPRKSHMIGFVPVVQPGNEEHVHHILFFECYVPNSDTHFEQWLEGRGTQCYSANMPVSWHYCKSMVIGWAIGGKGEMFPLNAGFPVGEEHGGATYFMMETHYDNPNMRRGVVDSSGLRIFYTEKLREHDAGLLMVGHGVVPQHIVPPKQQRFISAGFCDSSCTKQSLPVGGVSVFQGVLHSHLLGASLVLRHIRNGQELPVILQDMKYDFNYQSTRVLKEEIRLLPGDTLLTECYYDSSNRTMPTFGGFGTKEEMCLAFIGYYPRVNLFSCTSKPQLKDILAPLGIEKVIMDQKSKGNPNAGPSGTRKASSQKMKPIVISNFHRNIRITAPQKYLNMSLYDVLHDERTWRDPTVTDSFQQMTTSGVHEAKCYTRSDKPSKVEKLVPYPSFRTLRQKPDQCALAKYENSWTGDELCPSILPSCRNSKKPNIYF